MFDFEVLYTGSNASEWVNVYCIGTNSMLPLQCKIVHVMCSVLACKAYSYVNLAP